MEYLIRLKNFWFPDWSAVGWFLLAFPALYFFQTVIHEGSHGLTALANRGSMPIVAPFPHLRQSNGDFLNGVTLPLTDGSTSEVPVPVERQLCNSPAATPNPRLAGWIGMPQVVDIILMVGLSLITLFANIRSPMFRFLLRIWLFGVWIDFFFNTARNLVGACKEGQDWSRVMLRGDINDAAFAILTWFLWSAFLSHFIWVFWSAWGKNPVAETRFWDYRWIALVLSLLSIIAIILSFAIDDNRIAKDNAAFIVPLVFQFLSAVWCAIYFGLTFKYQNQST